MQPPNHDRPGARPSPSALALDLWQNGQEPGQLIPLLQKTQEQYGYIPEHAIRTISSITRVPESEIYGVITFYKQFRLKPLGRYLIRLCDGTACHVNDARTLMNLIKEELQLDADDTTADGLFTLTPVACLGCCSLAPVIMINDETFGRLTPPKVRQILKEFRQRAATEDAATRGGTSA
ncbi:MAG: NADH dehydrogenase, NuoE-like subunit [Candidatus Ozemobacter sibiricus]|uniref:NADH dehydrogenase, NuoE-like subunit n=1 Tax=Candidatus Ozemobacter sibiricus TaxID=2268124 RepID=A0A367ZR11_9BACT|nr:MAG: NADH dehydrogenase, NuoE-like subunit [Candidatus Ozemobacter sibiricus]